MSGFTRFMIAAFAICLVIIMIATLSGCKSKTETNMDTRNTEQSVYPDSGRQETAGQNVKQPVSEGFKYHWFTTDDFPAVSVVIDDFGNINGDLLDGFLSLDKSVTFAILPDLPQTKKTAELASIRGHEIIIHIPMEALDKKQNPGKRYIRTSMDDASIQDLLTAFIKQTPQAIGINNHMGSGATSDAGSMSSVMNVLKENGLFFLDSRTAASSKAYEVAQNYKVPFVSRDIFLDVPDVSAATLNQKLKDLEKFKGRQEPVIIITHCHNKTKLDAVRTFITQLKGLGIRLIPLSEAVEKFNAPI
jgi:uncharacterized protein